MPRTCEWSLATTKPCGMESPALGNSIRAAATVFTLSIYFYKSSILFNNTWLENLNMLKLVDKEFYQ